LAGVIGAQLINQYSTRYGMQVGLFDVQLKVDKHQA